MERRDLEFLGHLNALNSVSRSYRALNRCWNLLARYLRPEWPRMMALAVILCATIGVQIATPLVASRFIDRATSGELIERVDGDVATLARFFSRFVVYVVGNGLLIFGMLALLMSVDWRIGLALSAFVLLVLVVMLRIRAAATPSWAAERQATAELYGFVGEYLAGLEDVRSSGAGAFVLRRCAEVMRSWFTKTRAAQMKGYAMVASSHCGR